MRQAGWDYNGEHTDNMITPGAWDDTQETFLSFYLKDVIDKKVSDEHILYYV